MHDAIHDAHGDTGYCEDYLWIDFPGLDLFPDPVLVTGEFPGVSRDDLPRYVTELRLILGARYREEDPFPETARVVRSKHILWEVRENPWKYFFLSSLSDREVMRVVSMILREMHQTVLNSKNRGKFLVQVEQQ